MNFDGLDCLGADPTLDDVATGKAALKRGSKGAAVTYVQQHLGFVGGDVDGDYGPKTEQRVKEFQNANGLKDDGEVGKETMSAIDAMVMRGQKFSPVPTLSPVAAPVIAPASKPTASIPSTASVKVPPASTIATEVGTPFTTKVAYGLGGLAALGLGYAVLKRGR